MALLGWLHARGVARGWPRVPVFLAAFAASELVYPVLFPWYFGACVHDVPAFTQIAERLGAFLHRHVQPLLTDFVAENHASGRLRTSSKCVK